MCTTNCSHFLDCESHHGLYECNCQAGFTGPNCDINIDECTVSPCVNGRCVDGVNRYDCVCNDGYWGTDCEKKIHNPEGKLHNTASISFWQDHGGCPEIACSSSDDCVLCWEITVTCWSFQFASNFSYPCILSFEKRRGLIPTVEVFHRNLYVEKAS